MNENRRGLRTNRFKSNPLEKEFSDAWVKFGILNLDDMLDTRKFQMGRAPEVSERDEIVAATVIQWLGSPVGQNWLRDLGYERKESK